MKAYLEARAVELRTMMEQTKSQFDRLNGAMLECESMLEKIKQQELGGAEMLPFPFTSEAKT